MRAPADPRAPAGAGREARGVPDARKARLLGEMPVGPGARASAIVTAAAWLAALVLCLTIGAGATDAHAGARCEVESARGGAAQALVRSTRALAERRGRCGESLGTG